MAFRHKISHLQFLRETNLRQYLYLLASQNGRGEGAGKRVQLKKKQEKDTYGGGRGGHLKNRRKYTISKIRWWSIFSQKRRPKDLKYKD